MRINQMIGFVVVIVVLGLIGAFRLEKIEQNYLEEMRAFLIQPTSASAQRTVPIGRYEFPQDGVVCYRTNQGTQGVALSCVKTI